MGAGRKTETFYAPSHPKGVPSATSGYNSTFHGFRNLQKCDLGGVIFGCKNETINECLTKQLFGLPSSHYSYIKNIDQGLPLFLFNYSDRQMHGIFEAAGPGALNIDPYAWSDDGTARTPYPAQVQIFTKKSYLPLSEPDFKKVIGDNYYAPSHFWFELDRAQTKKLISLFKPTNPGYAPVSIPHSVEIPSTNQANAQPSLSYKQTLLNHLNPSNTMSALAQDYGSPSKAGAGDTDLKDDFEVQYTWDSQVEWENNYNNDAKTGHDAVYDNNNPYGTTQFDAAPCSGFDEQTVLNRLRALALEREKLIGCTSESPENECALDAESKLLQVPVDSSCISHLQLSQSNGNHNFMQIFKELMDRVTEMQKKQIESDKEVKWLNNIVNQSEKKIFQLERRLEELEQGLGISTQYKDQSEKLIYLVGGFNNVDWLSSFDAFVASEDQLMPLKSMSCARAYASTATLGELIFVIGGGDGNLWSDLVECYSRSADEWIQCPPLSCSKGCLAGVALGGKIFAIGGGDGQNCFSCMEMLDASVGKWVISKSMNEKRFAPGAVELNGAIYTVGGYDGKHYLRSAERYDPREGYWARLPCMVESRGCLSLATINEKLYAVGGFDGKKMVSSLEIFDPRLQLWVPGVPMLKPRGYAASAVIDETFYMMGGLSNEDEVTEIVECFDEHNGWHAAGFKSIGKRTGTGEYDILLQFWKKYRKTKLSISPRHTWFLSVFGVDFGLIFTLHCLTINAGSREMTL